MRASSQHAALKDLARTLYALRHTAKIVPYRKVGIGDGSLPDDWTPAPKHCYANVEVWVAQCPEYRSVRGWVAFDFTKSPIVKAHYHFVAHSVVEAPDGTLMDITPADISQLYPFIRHPGTIEEFNRLIREPNIMFLNHDLEA